MLILTLGNYNCQLRDRGFSTSIKEQVGMDIKNARERSRAIPMLPSWNWDGMVCSIDQGADLVAGHHPHVIQGIEKYKGKYIVYSLANFCFGGNRNPSLTKIHLYFKTLLLSRGKELISVKGKVIPVRFHGKRSK